jgi:hypothetical protein
MCGKDSYDSRQASVAGLCKHGTILLGSITLVNSDSVSKVTAANLQQFSGAEHKYDN